MNKHQQKVLFSSDKQNWETPQDLFNGLNDMFHFDLDPCATKENAKCEKYFTIEDDGLSKSWAKHTVFVNPPYSQSKLWIKKAYEESKILGTTVVCLVPARTDTKTWHNYCMKAERIYFISGRLRFSNSEFPAPFPSAVIVFRNSSPVSMESSCKNVFSMNKFGKAI